MALTVAETKEVKADIDWMQALWEEKYQHHSQSSNSRTDSPAETSASANGEEDPFDLSFRHSFHHTLDSDFVKKLLSTDNRCLDNDQLLLRLQLLSELKIPQEDILISSIKIGQGGFGEVFLGNYKRKYKVAIKTIRHLDDPNAEIKRRLIENELLLMRYLGNYPTILSCYGYVMNGSSMQIVLELAPYASLDKILRDSTSFPFDSFPLTLSLAWLCDLADAIKFLHAKNIKHRDIKAENMLLFDGLRMKLCDFGPAKQHFLDVTAESRIGTFCFMAPEIRVGKVSELASDIFSFGMTAVQIISRKNPKIDNFKGQVSETFSLPLVAKQVNSNVVKKLTVLFCACVAYDAAIAPAKLRPSAENVAEELLEILDGDMNGDPREQAHGSYESIKKLEEKIKKITKERHENAKQAANKNRSNTYFFRPQHSQQYTKEEKGKEKGGGSKAQSSERKSSEKEGEENNSRPVSAKSVTTTSSIGSISLDQYEVQSASSKKSNALQVRSFDATSIASSLNRSLSRTPGSVPKTTAEKNNLIQYLLSCVGCDAKDASQVATILIRSKITTIAMLQKEIERNPDLLLDLGLDLHLAEMITVHFLDQYNEQQEQSQRITEEKEDQMDEYGIDLPISPPPAYGATSYDSFLSPSVASPSLVASNGRLSAVKEIEEKNKIIRYLMSETGCELQDASQVATILLRSGILSIEILRRRIERNPDLLLDLGLELELAEAITMHFLESLSPILAPEAAEITRTPSSVARTSSSLLSTPSYDRTGVCDSYQYPRSFSHNRLSSRSCLTSASAAPSASPIPNYSFIEENPGYQRERASVAFPDMTHFYHQLAANLKINSLNSQSNDGVDRRFLSSPISSSSNGNHPVGSGRNSFYSNPVPSDYRLSRSVSGYSNSPSVSAMRQTSFYQDRRCLPQQQPQQHQQHHPSQLERVLSSRHVQAQPSFLSRDPRSSLPHTKSSFSLTTGENDSSTSSLMVDNSSRLPSEISRLYYEATLSNNKSSKEPFEALQEAALKGSRLAEGFLMRMYALGLGTVEKNIEVAIEIGDRVFPWLQDAFTANNAVARVYIQFLIGVCYSEGLGCAEDKREGLRW
jgi:serine/threonine protein kinase